MAKSEPSLVDEAESLTGKTAALSTVQKVAATMPAALRAEFAQALTTPTVSSEGLAKALARRGYTISDTAIAHFRRRGRSL